MNYFFRRKGGGIVSADSVNGIRAKALAYLSRSDSVTVADIYSDRGYVGNVYRSWNPAYCPIWTARPTPPEPGTIATPSDRQNVLNDDGSLGDRCYRILPFDVYR